MKIGPEGFAGRILVSVLVIGAKLLRDDTEPLDDQPSLRLSVVAPKRHVGIPMCKNIGEHRQAPNKAKLGIGNGNQSGDYGDIPAIFLIFINALNDNYGGEGGIRTPDTVTRMPHFECGAFNHSAT